MKWPLPYPTRGEIAGILLLAAFLAMALFGPLIFQNADRKTNANFEQTWDCVNPGYGEPVCIKHPAKTGE
jgi:hypothetical protein